MGLRHTGPRRRTIQAQRPLRINHRPLATIPVRQLPGSGSLRVRLLFALLNHLVLATGTTKKDPWEKFSWASLPEQYKRNWMTLGFTAQTWDDPDRYGICCFLLLARARTGELSFPLS
jgi:hypothetical protein